MALWAYIFLRLGLKNDNLYSHPPSQISPSPISPPPILPYPNPPSRLLWPVWLFKHKEYLPQRMAKERDKKYRGFYFLYCYGDFTLYFLSRSFAVCGILWKTTWLHNVDNIRQKDIKKLVVIPFFVATNFKKIVNYFIFEMLRKFFCPFFKELENFLPKNLSAASVRHWHSDIIRVESGTAGHGLVRHCPAMPICSFIAVLWFRGILGTDC